MGKAKRGKATANDGETAESGAAPATATPANDVAVVAAVEVTAAPAASATPDLPAAPAELEYEDDLLPILESLLFAAHESLSAQRMARAIGHLKAERVSRGLEALQRQYEEKRSPLMLAEIAGGWRLVTRPEYAPFLARLFSKAEKERLSSAALETLAIVAYRQPATRAEIEAVRGVQVGPVLKLLQERRLVKMVGRAEVVGRPLQYGTTRKFLDHFGLASLEELPKVFPGRTLPGAISGGTPTAAGAGAAGDSAGDVADAVGAGGDGAAQPVVDAATDTVGIAPADASANASAAAAGASPVSAATDGVTAD